MVVVQQLTSPPPMFHNKVYIYFKQYFRFKYVSVRSNLLSGGFLPATKHTVFFEKLSTNAVLDGELFLIV